MARFSKDEMLDELRAIFLFEADHILLGAGDEMAERFIGFPPGEHREYCFMDPKQVDLSRFQITRAFEDGYDVAFRPSVMNTLGEHEVQDLLVFMEGTPRIGGIFSGGEMHAFMRPEGMCRTVADTVHARWKLEWDNGGDADHTFTTREIALLADMTEGAVRNALADKSESGLTAIPGRKNPIEIEKSEALRWLKGRRGFIASPDSARTDRFLLQHLQELQSCTRLSELIRLRLNAVSISKSETAKRLGWSEAELQSWFDGLQIFDAVKAAQLAEALDIDEPTFVGKALEVTMRRDQSAGQGEAK